MVLTLEQNLGPEQIRALLVNSQVLEGMPSQMKVTRDEDHTKIKTYCDDDENYDIFE